MEKDDIINYVMETPGNSNPAVLGSMLDSYSGGGSSGGLLVHVAHEEGGAEFTCDKTWKEIKDVVDAGGVVYFDIENPLEASTYKVLLSYISESDGIYYASSTESSYSFTTDSENGYPSAYWD